MFLENFAGIKAENISGELECKKFLSLNISTKKIQSTTFYDFLLYTLKLSLI
jgi:hypothetical protein